jgi:hypothetical protein
LKRWAVFAEYFSMCPFFWPHQMTTTDKASRRVAPLEPVRATSRRLQCDLICFSASQLKAEAEAWCLVSSGVELCFG